MIQYKIIFFITTFLSITIYSSQPAQSSGIVTTTVTENKKSQPALFCSIIELENEVQKIVKLLFHDHTHADPEQLRATTSEIRKNFLENDEQKACLSEYYFLRAYHSVNYENCKDRLFTQEMEHNLNSEFPKDIKSYVEYKQMYQDFARHFTRQQFIILQIISKLDSRYTKNLQERLNIQNCGPLFNQYLQYFTPFLQAHSDNDFQFQKNKEKALGILRKKALIMDQQPLTQQSIRISLRSTNQANSTGPQTFALNINDMLTRS